MLWVQSSSSHESNLSAIVNSFQSSTISNASVIRFSPNCICSYKEVLVSRGLVDSILLLTRHQKSLGLLDSCLLRNDVYQIMQGLLLYNSQVE